MAENKDSSKEDGAPDRSQETDESDEGGAMGFLSALLSQLSMRKENTEEEKPPQVLETLDLEGVAKHIKSGKAKNIIVMSGAGISTSAGIPDFRSPNSGLYDNLQKYNLPSPQSMFEIGFFMRNPEPFFELAKELYPGKFKPTPCHYFIKLLGDKGVLLRHFTQNIDNLDRLAGLAGEKIVEAHGSFHLSHCLGECEKEYSEEWMKKKIYEEEVGVVRCDDCGGLVKPDIVFFGEGMPPVFFQRLTEDLPKCDLAIIMGTSLVVQPFASLVDRVPKDCPRLLINMEKSGQADPLMQMLGLGRGMDFDSENNYRDVAYLGKCDDGCFELARLLGWKEELETLIKEGHEKLDAEMKATEPQTAKVKSQSATTECTNSQQEKKEE